MNLRILIVDNHPIVRESLRHVLGAAGGFQLEEVASGEEAMRTVRRRRPDLVLLDVELESCECGLELLSRLKAHDASLPVLVHSYQDSPLRLSRSFHRGASGFVRKGVDVIQLVDAIWLASSGGTNWSEEQMRAIVRNDADWFGEKADSVGPSV